MTSIDRSELMRRVFPSQEMANYMAGQELSSETLVEAISGAPIPLAEKLKLFQALTRRNDDQFAILARETEQALHALNLEPGEFFYVKNGWPDYEVGDEDIAPMEPYPDLQLTLRGIHRFLEDEECWEESCYWFILEKWSLRNGEYICPYSYIMVDDEMFYFEKGPTLFSPSTLPYKSTDLNLPIPFHPGDIVWIDCSPFAFRAKAVLLEVGDNRDCCGVQAMFRKENGNWSAGALKHSHVFPKYYAPQLSPLYRLSLVQEELTEEERILKEVSEFVAGSDQRGYALWEEIVERYDHGACESDIRSFISGEKQT